MSGIFTDNFLFRAVKNFEETITRGNTRFYIFFARPIPWADDENPTLPLNTLNYRNDVWSNITAMKRVYESDISLAFRKILWEQNTVYSYYTDREPLENRNYYVINSRQEVFKCIDNNNEAPSTVEPSTLDHIGEFLDIFQAEDGYRWKYMFRIPESLFRKFETEQFAPISSNQDVINSAVPGTIDFVEINNTGSGFSSNLSIPIFIAGDGDSVSSAEINILETNVEGGIEDFQFSERGSKYIFDSGRVTVPVQIQQKLDENTTSLGGEVTLGFEPAYGIATINPETREIENLEIIRKGKNYSTASARIIQSSALAYAQTDSSGQINSIDYVFRGKNFRRASAELVTAETPLEQANLQPIISPPLGHGGEPNRELNVNSVVFSVYSIFDESNKFSVNNDYRISGLIENPISSSTLEPATGRALNVKYELQISEPNAKEYQSDESILGSQSEAEGIVVDTPDDYTVRYIKQNETVNFQVGEQILSPDGRIVSTIEKIIEPDVVPYSGEILLINNGKPITRNQNQIESTTFIISF